MSQAETTTIVGIDEAGYGPLLGPLVIAATAFDIPVSIMKGLPDPAAGPDLWSLLSRSIKATPNRRDPRLAVADSKKLHGKGNDGLNLLERAALTFLSVSGSRPESLRDLLARVCPDALDQVAAYPWYADADPRLPTCCATDDLATQRNALTRDLESAGIRFRGAWVQVLTEGHYNRIVSVTNNKAVVLFNEAMRLVLRVSEANGHRPLRVWIDRQGGRTHYRHPLMRAFEGSKLDVLEESEARSGYRIQDPQSQRVIRFVRKGELHHMPIALASVMAKYVRELFMLCLNGYWAQRVADLRPTAGYYEDGQRFLADIAVVLETENVQRQWMVRML